MDTRLTSHSAVERREDDDEFLWLPNHTDQNVPDSSVRRQESILSFGKPRQEQQNHIGFLRTQE